MRSYINSFIPLRKKLDRAESFQLVKLMQQPSVKCEVKIIAFGYLNILKKEK